MNYPPPSPYDAPYKTGIIYPGWGRSMTDEEVAYYNAMFPVPPNGNQPIGPIPVPNVFPEAPSDGLPYRRQNRSWIADPVKDDAPADDNVYGRAANGWLALESPGVIGAVITTLAGQEQIALPDYSNIQFDTVTGAAFTKTDDNVITSTIAGDLVVQVATRVTAGWGNYVVFGYAKNGGDAVELGRVLVQSGTPVPVAARYDLTVAIGDTLEILISSDFAYASFAWTVGEIQVYVKG